MSALFRLGLFRLCLFRLSRLCSVGVCVAAITLVSPIWRQSIQAQEAVLPTPVNNPAISFRRPLRVNNVRISNNWELRRSQYLFTFDFPTDAVEPLEKLVFTQVEGVGYPRYQAEDSYAFETDSQMRLSLSAVENDSAQRAIAVVFDPPVEPGGQVTVALRARNPRDGIYVYQLSAFPAGASTGQYAGVERLNFYRPSRDRFRYR